MRGNRGAGNIVAVVQMINKFHGTVQEGGVAKPNYVPFDSHDEETLALCVQRVADDLGKLMFVCVYVSVGVWVIILVYVTGDRFAELLLVGDQFCGSAILIPSGNYKEKEPVGVDRLRRFDDPTFSSRNRK